MLIRRESSISLESVFSFVFLSGDYFIGKVRVISENGVLFLSMLKFGFTVSIDFKDCSKILSYLKLSCVVSGYGRYS